MVDQEGIEKCIKACVDTGCFAGDSDSEKNRYCIYTAGPCLYRQEVMKEAGIISYCLKWKVKDVVKYLEEQARKGGEVMKDGTN